MQKLSHYPQSTAFRFIANACQRYEAGDMGRVAFETFCHAVLNDERPAVVRELAIRLPIPTEVPDTDTQALEALANALPGLRHAFDEHRLPKTEKGRKMQEQRSALYEKDDALAQLVNAWEICNRHWPWWTAVLQHPDASVRLAGVSRLPTEEPLSLLLPWVATDVATVVRSAARAKLGIVLKVPPATWRDYRKGLIGLDAARAEIRSEATTMERRKTYLTDPRTRVRFEAAVMLPEDDSSWIVLAADPSPRLRRLAAERLPRNSAALRGLTQDPNGGVATIALRRAWEAFDAGEGPQPKTGRPIRADVAARRAWKEKLEAYFPEN